MILVFHKITDLRRPASRLGAQVLRPLMLTGAVSGMLTGCVSSEKVRTSHNIEFPDQYVSTQKQPDQAPLHLSGWTGDFQNETIEALVFEALDNNRNLRVAAARVEEARALARVQTGAMLPSLSAGGNGARSRVNVPDGLGGKNKSLGNGYGASLDLSWEIDLWGKLNNRRRAASLDYRGQEDTYRAAQLSLTGQVINGWFALVEAEEQLKLAAETEESFTRAERMVRGRYEQGLRRALDVRLAASNAASAQALTATRREQVKASSTRLEVLLGRYPAGLLSGDGDLPKLDVQWSDELPSSLLARRPDLSAAHAQAVAAELRGSAALKDMLPSLRLSGSGGYQDGELKDLEDPANLIWTLAGGLIQPLFQGGALKARADAAQARGDQALAQYAQSLLTAFQEVEVALFSEETLALRETALEKSAAQAKAAEQSASDLYSQGLTGIFELLEAQRRSLNAQSSYLDVRRQRLANRVTLYMALGGDVPTSSPTKIVSAEMYDNQPVEK